MGLTEEEKEALAALQAKEKEEDFDPDDYVEVWDKDGNGARMRHSHGKKWLQDHGFLAPDESPSDKGDSSSDKDAKKPATDRKSTSHSGPAQRYFGGKRPAGK
jgi:hypothetical protein